MRFFRSDQNDLGRSSSIAHRDRAATRTHTGARRAVVGREGRLDAGPQCAQQDEGPEGSWVHAYLHRKEGDQGNAAYWYGRAGKPVCREPLDAEWRSIARALLG